MNLPIDRVEDAGDTTYFTCSAIGNGTLSIKWLLPSGDIVYPDQFITIGLSTIDLECWFDPFPWQIVCVLTIEYITADVGGNHTCIAENDIGFTEATAVLPVNLYISGDMIGLDTTTGTTENITCMIEGFPISYVWQKGIETVSDDGSGSVSGSGSGSGSDIMSDIGSDSESDSGSNSRSDSGSGSGSGSGNDIMSDTGSDSMDELMVTYMNVSTGRYLELNPVIFGDEGVYRCVAQSGVGDELISDAITVTSE